MDPLQLHYWYGDELEVLSHPLWMPVRISRKGIFGQIQLMEQSGRQYRKFLGRYPDVLCEPLEHFYIFRRRTAALTPLLVEDWLTRFGWREVNEGLWLIVLAPQPEYRPLLEEAKQGGRWPYAAQGMDLALAACGGPVSDEVCEPYERAIRVREMLAELPQSPMPLRPPTTEALDRQGRREIKVIREVYRRDGLDAAREMMKQGVVGYTSMRHAEWMKRGCPPPPEFVDIEDESDIESSEAVDSSNSPGVSERSISVSGRKWWKFWQ